MSMPARGEEVSELPSELYIEPTNRCNSKCNICVRTFRESEGAKDLSIDEFKAIVNQFPGLRRVVLHGIGEPLLNKDIFRMVSHLKSKGVYVLFNSNAILLRRGVQKELIESGLDELRVSIDSATPETYRKMRGVSRYNEVIDNIKEFNELKKSLQLEQPKVSLWFVATKENIWELPDLIKTAAEVGVPEVHLQRLTFMDSQEALGIAREGNAIYQNPDRTLLTLIDDCEKLAHELGIIFSSSGATTPTHSIVQREKVNSPWQKCLRPWALSYVTVNGNVLPCCIAPFSTIEYDELVLGNVFDEAFTSIWNNNGYKALRKRLMTENPPQCCKGCGEKWSL
jgi:MoaA/NifB/PqqE/SkfB family radical SAM enzyme